MKRKGTVSYNGRNFNYRIDEHRTLWIRDSTNAEFNMGQVRPLNDADDIDTVLIDMLRGAGY